MCSHSTWTVESVIVYFGLTGVVTPKEEIVELAVVEEQVWREFQLRKVVCYLERAGDSQPKQDYSQREDELHDKYTGSSPGVVESFCEECLILG